MLLLGLCFAAGCDSQRGTNAPGSAYPEIPPPPETGPIDGGAPAVDDKPDATPLGLPEPARPPSEKPEGTMPPPDKTIPEKVPPGELR
jgi:hypothetical protein